MGTAQHDIVVQIGAAFKLSVKAQNEDGSILDLSGYTGKMQVRADSSSSTVLMEANTTNGTMTINGPTGVISVLIGADVTAAFTWTTGVYDLIVMNSTANVLRLVEGFAATSPDVSR